LIGGGLDDGSENEPLAIALAGRFTSYNYARRGRGGSGDTPPYAIEREVEDLAALIEHAEPPAHLVGVSSGGMLAFEAAALDLPVQTIAVYEIPYDTSHDARQRFDDYRAQLDIALRDGRRADAIELFMRVAGAGDAAIAGARSSAVWPHLEELAHTLAYDAAMYGPPPLARLTQISQSVVVATGGSDPFFEMAADAVAQAIPNSERVVLAGQGHVVDPSTMAEMLTRCFDRRRPMHTGKGGEG
jgi:pimeloyl-ACP methyl ester carboxylesterase